MQKKLSKFYFFNLRNFVKKKTREYIAPIQKLYVSSEFKKYPNVISKILLFFANSGARIPQIYSAIIQVQ